MTAFVPVQIDHALLLIILLQRFSPNEPVEITDVDFQRVRAAFPHGPGLKAIVTRFNNEPVISLEVITSAEGQALDRKWGLS